MEDPLVIQYRHTIFIGNLMAGTIPICRVMEMAGKYGYPYFANFMNSDLQVEDV